MLRSIFMIFMSFGISFGAFQGDEKSNGNSMRSYYDDKNSSYPEVRYHLRDTEKSYFVQESKMPTNIHQLLLKKKSAELVLKNKRLVNLLRNKITQNVLDDYLAISRKAESAIRKVDKNNEMLSKMVEDDILELNSTSKEAEEYLMNRIDLENRHRYQEDIENENCTGFDETAIEFIYFYGTIGYDYWIRLGDNESLKKAGFNVEKNTEIFIHDYSQDTLMNFIQIGTSVEQNMMPSNIFYVDWSSYSNCKYNHTVTKIVPSVGMIVAKLLKQLVDFGTDIKKIHLIGNGIGAQIASVAAKQFPDTKIARITGLDPAGPGYNLKPASLRLDKTDADFVDVIHTDMYFYGTWKAVGHVDFYPNGGASQSGCAEVNLCNHQRAMSYYLESLFFLFYGVECDDYKSFNSEKCFVNKLALMGQNLSSSTRGRYYLNTADSAPYGMDKIGATPWITSRAVRQLMNADKV